MIVEGVIRSLYRGGLTGNDTESGGGNPAVIRRAGPADIGDFAQLTQLHILPAPNPEYPALGTGGHNLVMARRDGHATHIALEAAPQRFAGRYRRQRGFRRRIAQQGRAGCRPIVVLKAGEHAIAIGCQDDCAPR